jgi:hypothetical protein
MSHHFDYTADERLDISDAYCFAGPRDAAGPRTVFGMNASPNGAGPWDPAGYYELKVDTNEDLVEDITWRFTFPVDSAGVQHVVVAELTGREATDRNAKAGSSRPANAPVGRSWRWSAASRSSPARAPTRSSTSFPSPSRWPAPSMTASSRTWPPCSRRPTSS